MTACLTFSIAGLDTFSGVRKAREALLPQRAFRTSRTGSRSSRWDGVREWDRWGWGQQLT